MIGSKIESEARMIFFGLLLFCFVCGLGAQTRPSLFIREFSGGPGYDSENIAAMLSGQSIIRNNFMVVPVAEGANYFIDGTIRAEGFGHTVVFTISRGNNTLGTESIWYRDLVEIGAYMPTIAATLAGRAIPQLALSGQPQLPQFTQAPAPEPVTPPPPPVVTPPPPRPAAPQQVPQIPTPPIPPLPSEEGERDLNAWRNHWIYVGGSLGYAHVWEEKRIQRTYYYAPGFSYTNEWWESESKGFATFAAKGDFSFTRLLGAEINLVFVSEGLFIPLLAKIGWRWSRVEASLNGGYEPMLGLGVVGATLGFNLGPGVIFFDGYYGGGGDANSNTEMGWWSLGYKVGVRPRAPRQ